MENIDWIPQLYCHTKKNLKMYGSAATKCRTTRVERSARGAVTAFIEPFYLTSQRFLPIIVHKMLIDNYCF